MKSYKEFIRESKKDIHSICDEYGINDYTINPDGSIDVDGNVILSYDFERGELTKIPLKFAKVIGDFECDRNQLTTLKGSPTSVGGDFHCSGNKLISLEYCPESVGSHFYCQDNQLTSLEYCPEIGRDLNCRRNKITDFRGVPEFFEGYFFCEGNPIEEIYALFKDSKCIQWINEFDVIRGHKVIMDRLEEVFYQLGMDVPENIKFKSYKVI